MEKDVGKRHGCVIAAVLALIAGCGRDGTTLHGHHATCPGGVRMLVPVGMPERTVDILAVMDPSASIVEEQLSLLVEFESMVGSLLDPGAGHPGRPPVRDIHAGVISMDMGTGGYPIETCTDPVDGDDGVLLHEPTRFDSGCESTYPPFLECSGEDPSCAGWLANHFMCIALLGNDGCGWEQAFKAVSRALVDHRDGPNAGFLREGSILVVMFVSDEEEWSVAPGSESIFDASDPTLGPMALRCFNHPEMLVPVEEYVDVFESLRSDPEKLLLAFFVGVPMDPACEGSGDRIGGCLEHPDMIEVVDPLSPTRLVPSCATSNAEGYPARRYVGMALRFGERAVVHSSCEASYRPAVEMLADKIGERVGSVPLDAALPVARDEVDPCVCRSSCTLVEELPGGFACPPERPCLEPGGPGTGCAFEEGEAGERHALCTIPQADTRLEDCSMECDVPGAGRTVDGDGLWYYSVSPAAGPRIVYTGVIDTVAGSEIYLSCCS